MTTRLIKGRGKNQVEIRGMGTTFAAKTADYTILDDDGVVNLFVTTGATDRTMTLPTAADNSGRIITVKKVDSGANKVILDGEGAETIDGALTQTGITSQYDFCTLQCDGTEWHIINKRFSTEDGLKQYDESTAYSNGTPTVTVSSGTWTDAGSVLIPYQTEGGSWRLRFNLHGTMGTSSSNFTITISNVTFDGPNAVAASQFNNSSYYTLRAVANTTSISMNYSNLVTLPHISGDVLLTAKPTWAD